MLHQLKNLVPQGLKDTYHFILSFAAALWYNYPSKKMIVIGVTGTNGKTSTAYMISKALEAGGAKPAVPQQPSSKLRVKSGSTILR